MLSWRKSWEKCNRRKCSLHAPQASLSAKSLSFCSLFRSLFPLTFSTHFFYAHSLFARSLFSSLLGSPQLSTFWPPQRSWKSKCVTFHFGRQVLLTFATHFFAHFFTHFSAHILLTVLLTFLFFFSFFFFFFCSLSSVSSSSHGRVLRRTHSFGQDEDTKSEVSFCSLFSLTFLCFAHFFAIFITRWFLPPFLLTF